jgi:chaperone required for assembly of F1-ATPase
LLWRLVYCISKLHYNLLGVILVYVYRKLSVNDVIHMSRLEEEFQAEIWGTVEGGHDIDRLHNKIRISSAYLFHQLLVHK